MFGYVIVILTSTLATLKNINDVLNTKGCFLLVLQTGEGYGNVNTLYYCSTKDQY